MPGAVPIASAYALTKRDDAASAVPGLARRPRGDQGKPGWKVGINVAGGHVTYLPVVDGVGVAYVPADEALGAAVPG